MPKFLHEATNSDLGLDKTRQSKKISLKLILLLLGILITGDHFFYLIYFADHKYDIIKFLEIYSLFDLSGKSSYYVILAKTLASYKTKVSFIIVSIIILILLIKKYSVLSYLNINKFWGRYRFFLYLCFFLSPLLYINCKNIPDILISLKLDGYILFFLTSFFQSLFLIASAFLFFVFTEALDKLFYESRKR